MLLLKINQRLMVQNTRVPHLSIAGAGAIPSLNAFDEDLRYDVGRGGFARRCLHNSLRLSSTIV